LKAKIYRQFFAHDILLILLWHSSHCHKDETKQTRYHGNTKHSLLTNPTLNR